MFDETCFSDKAKEVSWENFHYMLGDDIDNEWHSIFRDVNPTVEFDAKKRVLWYTLGSVRLPIRSCYLHDLHILDEKVVTTREMLEHIFSGQSDFDWLVSEMTEAYQVYMSKREEREKQHA